MRLSWLLNKLLGRNTNRGQQPSACQPVQNAEDIDNEGLEVQVLVPMHDMDTEVKRRWLRLSWQLREDNKSRKKYESDGTVPRNRPDGALLPQGVLRGPV